MVTEGSGCGTAIARLLAVPAVLALVAALIPMAFGRSFVWQFAPITFILCLAIVLGIRLWVTRDRGQPRSLERFESHIGQIEVLSGTVIAGDGPDLGEPIRLTNLPSGPWEVRCLGAVDDGTALLEAVILEADAGPGPFQGGTHCLVIDRGQVVLVDEAASKGRFKSGSLEAEARPDRVIDPSGADIVLLLMDETGRPCGLTFAPPYGDGSYEMRVRRTKGGVQIRIWLGEDESE